jgi:hypothetical protein
MITIDNNCIIAEVQFNLHTHNQTIAVNKIEFDYYQDKIDCFIILESGLDLVEIQHDATSIASQINAFIEDKFDLTLTLKVNDNASFYNASANRAIYLKNIKLEQVKGFYHFLTQVVCQHVPA